MLDKKESPPVEKLGSAEKEIQGTLENTSIEYTWAEQFRELKKSRRTVCAALACSSAAVLVGYDMTLIGSIIANSEFIEHFGTYDHGIQQWTLPANYQLIWSIVQYIAAIAGAVGVGFLNDVFGRRICFFVIISLTLIGTAVELVSPGWKVWNVAKLLMGVAMGFMQANTPSYVSELSPVSIRGFMLSLFQFWINLGSFIGACVLEGTSTIVGGWSWKAAIASQFGLCAFCLLVFIPLVPESPFYLVRHHQPEKARAVLLRLRANEPGYSVDLELETIRETLDQELRASTEAPSYLDCFRGTDLRRTLIAVLPMVMQGFSGYSLCGNYLAYFLTMSGVSDAFVITVISMLCAIFATLLSFILVEKIGRRPQLLTGCAGMLTCLLAIGIIGCVNYPSRGSGIAVATFCIIWSIFYYLSVGAVGWTIVGEISSTRLRAKTTSLAAAMNSLFNMAFSIAIPYLINANEANLGPKTGFVFFAPFVLFAVIAFFTIPETKKLSFQELNYKFETRMPARKFQ
ncbi:uncharacterized protein N7459_007423 [Penicillium hispanicum]|uniref:uncharacterized protein n=1 Tax=Penicillium hispanicum TaxID=1080232 RepID=UPI002540DF02|nr:uncharacterized protein N7459_007423 [Penicillium hispanicum]KAJ5578459.1 hypothetical protein N7459_007423 [Penicillium hispanicum]